MVEKITDARNFVIGYRRDAGDRIVITDHRNLRLGYFDKARNYTFNDKNLRVGTGDQTMRLIFSQA